MNTSDPWIYYLFPCVRCGMDTQHRENTQNRIRMRVCTSCGYTSMSFQVAPLIPMESTGATPWEVLEHIQFHSEEENEE